MRGHAAAWVAMAMFSIRLIITQRSRLTQVTDGIVYAECDLDAKVRASECSMWTSEFDILCSAAWIAELTAARDGPPSTPFMEL